MIGYKQVEHKSIKFNILNLPNTNIFNYEICFNFGTRLEEEFKRVTGKSAYGIIHLTEHLSFKSPLEFKTKDFYNQLQANGKRYAYTSFNDVRFGQKSVDRLSTKVITLVNNSAFNDLSRVTDDELVSERKVVINEIKQGSDSLQTSFHRDEYVRAFDLDPMDTILGDIKVVESFTHEDLITIKSLLLNPEYFTVNLTVDITDEDMLNKLLDTITIDIYNHLFRVNHDLLHEFNFDNCKHKDMVVPPKQFEIDNEAKQDMLTIRHKLDKGISFPLTDFIATYCTKLDHDDNLFKHIRDTHGLTYTVSFYPTLSIEAGPTSLTFSVDVSKGDLDKVKEVYEESLTNILENLNEEKVLDALESYRLATELDYINFTSYEVIFLLSRMLPDLLPKINVNGYGDLDTKFLDITGFYSDLLLYEFNYTEFKDILSKIVTDLKTGNIIETTNKRKDT